MIGRHALWSGLASGRGAYADTPDKRLALARWNIVMLCDRFNWRYTPEEIVQLPQDWLDDAVTILNIRDHYANSQSSNVK